MLSLPDSVFLWYLHVSAVMTPHTVINCQSNCFCLCSFCGWFSFLQLTLNMQELLIVIVFNKISHHFLNSRKYFIFVSFSGKFQNLHVFDFCVLPEYTYNWLFIIKIMELFIYADDVCVFVAIHKTRNHDCKCTLYHSALF